MEIRLGENIRALRKQAGLTQEQLAEALGVTTGAVYKWESGRANPDLGLLVEMAEFFETSVDALLDYGWDKGSMGKAVEKLRACRREKDFGQGLRYAEQALKKFPNSFEVVFQSAELYFMSMVTRRGKSAQRAIELYEEATRLLDQNPYKDIDIVTIRNRIASCHCYLDQTDKAIELLQSNNVDGLNNAKIGLLMSQTAARAEESLRYLSHALYGGHARLYEVCIGYANAYAALGRPEGIEPLLIWLLEMGRGLRDLDVVGYMDKSEVRLLTILAEVAMERGEEAAACRWLEQARDTARRFDAAPEYHTHAGLKFYHGDMDAMSFDDMGETAMDMIENFLADDEAGGHLRPLWEQVQKGPAAP